MFGSAAYGSVVIITCHLKCMKFCAQNYFRAQHCQKIRIISKNTSNKNCWALSFVQKIQWTHLSTFPISGARGSKDCRHWNIIMHWNGKVYLLYGSTLPKMRIISRDASNKSCWAINFVQKCQWAHMCISTRSGTRLL